MEEADKEKALKQVAETSLKEKTLGLNVMERWATTAEKALELAKYKTKGLQGKLGENEIKLAEMVSLASTHDKELANLKIMMKARKQTYYNKGFKNAENSVGPVVFQARKFEFIKGWMAAVNAISLPDTSPFMSDDQILLCEDPEAEAQAPKQDEDSNEEEEGTDSLEMRDLSQQIDSHVVVLDEDNPTTAAPLMIQGITQLTLGSDPPITSEAPMTGLIDLDNPST